MRLFTGFSSDKGKTVRVPEGFFEEVLPAITSMLEMKVTLYLFHRLARSGNKGSAPRMACISEIEGDPRLRAVLAAVKGPRPLGDALREGLELAVSRGTLLQVWVREEPNDISDGRAEQWYMLNTRESRDWVEALGKGEIDVTLTPLAAGPMLAPPEEPYGNGSGPRPHLESPKYRVLVERPSVYTLYEQNIGLLTPLLAEKLQDAEARYPIDWIEAAFNEAVLNNKRNWRYIERILERWALEGRSSGKDRGLAERALDPDKYTKGKYAFLFRPDGQ